MQPGSENIHRTIAYLGDERITLAMARSPIEVSDKLAQFFLFIDFVNRGNY